MLTLERAKEIWQDMYDITSQVSICLDLNEREPTSKVTEREDEPNLLVTLLPITWWKKLTGNNKPKNMDRPTDNDLYIAFYIFFALLHEASRLKVGVMSWHYLPKFFEQTITPKKLYRDPVWWLEHRLLKEHRLCWIHQRLYTYHDPATVHPPPNPVEFYPISVNLLRRWWNGEEVPWWNTVMFTPTDETFAVEVLDADDLWLRELGSLDPSRYSPDRFERNPTRDLEYNNDSNDIVPDPHGLVVACFAREHGFKKGFKKGFTESFTKSYKAGFQEALVEALKDVKQEGIQEGAALMKWYLLNEHVKGEPVPDIESIRGIKRKADQMTQ